MTLLLVEWDAIHRPVETKKFTVYPEMNCNVGILRIFPGITHETVIIYYTVSPPHYQCSF